jgi:hypothetical protein
MSIYSSFNSSPSGGLYTEPPVLMDSTWSPPGPDLQSFPKSSWTVHMDSTGYILHIFKALTLKKRNGSSESQTLSFFWRHNLHALNHSANWPYYSGSQHAIHSAMADPWETTATAATHNSIPHHHHHPSPMTTMTNNKHPQQQQQQQHQVSHPITLLTTPATGPSDCPTVNDDSSANTGNSLHHPLR